MSVTATSGSGAQSPAAVYGGDDPSVVYAAESGASVDRTRDGDFTFTPEELVGYLRLNGNITIDVDHVLTIKGIPTEIIMGLIDESIPVFGALNSLIGDRFGFQLRVEAGRFSQSMQLLAKVWEIKIPADGVPLKISVVPKPLVTTVTKIVHFLNGLKDGVILTFEPSRVIVFTCESDSSLANFSASKALVSEKLRAFFREESRVLRMKESNLVAETAGGGGGCSVAWDRSKNTLIIEPPPGDMVRFTLRPQAVPPAASN